jgi:hypothetical protein
MKKHRFILHPTMLCLFALLDVPLGQAQSASHILKANIPFNFSVGPQKYSAGEYTLKPLLQQTTILRNERGQSLTNIQTNSVESREVPTSAKLVFTVYDGQYFLSQIWEPGNSIGRELATKSHVEIRFAQRVTGEQIALNVVPLD